MPGVHLLVMKDLAQLGETARDIALQACDAIDQIVDALIESDQPKLHLARSTVQTLDSLQHLCADLLDAHLATSHRAKQRECPASGHSKWPPFAAGRKHAIRICAMSGWALLQGKKRQAPARVDTDSGALVITR
jgi:hypothetical protein